MRLPFTFPPVAAVLLSPFSLVPMALAGTVLSLATIALTAVVLRLFLRSAAGPGAGSWWTIGWLLPVALLLEPMRHTLGYGQINVALMALVSADCLPATVRWPRGLLVGFAAAVKPTPAAFVLFFACRGDRRAVTTAAVTFAACAAAGFPLAWHDSVRYWTSVVFQTGRPGSLVNAANQSIQAFLVRAGLDPRAPAETAAWLALSALVVVLAWYGIRHAVARSAHARALSLNALAALLISPISWSHHWVWAEPALLVLAIGGLRDRHRGVLAGAAAELAVLAAAPQWWFPTGGNRETHWAAWQQAIGGSYVILAAVILLLSACLDAAGTPDRVGRTPARYRLDVADRFPHLHQLANWRRSRTYASRVRPRYPAGNPARAHTGHMGRMIWAILGVILAIWLAVTAIDGIVATLKTFLITGLIAAVVVIVVSLLAGRRRHG